MPGFEETRVNDYYERDCGCRQALSRCQQFVSKSQLMQTCCMQHLQNPVVMDLRKKLHHAREQSFSLKQQLSRQRKQIVELQHEVSFLQQEIRECLQQIKINDAQIQKYQGQLAQNSQYSLFLQQRVKEIQVKMDEMNAKASRQQHYIVNLNQENEMLIQMKRGLSRENVILKQCCDQVKTKYLLKEKQMQKLEVEVHYLIQDMKNLEELVHNKNEELLNYQIFLNTKDHELQQNRIIEKQCTLTNERVLQKLEKYKKKAIKYRQERDLLLKQIQEAKEEIGTITLRKDVSDEEPTLEPQYSFNDQIY